MIDTFRIIAGLFGAVVTIGIFAVTNAFRMGHHSARIESLESWRISVRFDMHEISKELEMISNQITNLTTLIQERTERRISDRE